MTVIVYPPLKSAEQFATPPIFCKYDMKQPVNNSENLLQDHCLQAQNLLALQEHERLKVSLNLQETIGRSLAALKVMGQNMSAMPKKKEETYRQTLAQWTSILDQCIDSVRALATSLQPPDLLQNDLQHAIEILSRKTEQRIGTNIDFRATGLARLCPVTDYSIAINLYRVVQEALRNIEAHAAAQHIEMRIIAAGSSILISIKDDGRGFDLGELTKETPQSNRFGLFGMRERVRALNGTIKIQSAPTQGTTIFIEVPWQEIYGGVHRDGGHR